MLLIMRKQDSYHFDYIAPATVDAARNFFQGIEIKLNFQHYLDFLMVDFLSGAYAGLLLLSTIITTIQSTILFIVYYIVKQ